MEAGAPGDLLHIYRALGSAEHGEHPFPALTERCRGLGVHP